MHRAHVVIAVASCLAAFAPSCRDYESPGSVAGESVWSHVPPGADGEPQLGSERLARQREVGTLEERLANLSYRVDRLGAQLEERRATTDGEVLRERVARLRTSIRDAQRDVAALRELYEQPEVFRERRDAAHERVSDLEGEAQELRQALPGA